MVRTPAKTCPQLTRLLDEAEPEMFAEYLGTKAFERLDWLKGYWRKPSDGEDCKPTSALLRETRQSLLPLETEAARVMTMAADRGQFALGGLVTARLSSARLDVFQELRDEVARSLWTYINEIGLFEAAENSLNLRLYRRYGKHYQTFMVEPSNDTPPADVSVFDLLGEDLRDKFDLDKGFSVDRYDLPSQGEEPSSVMYLMYHPNPPTSVREIDDDGNRSRIYIRPPGEAMIVHTPSTGLVHVRAGTRKFRHEIARKFIENILEMDQSKQPVDFQAYDISQFFSGFHLSLPKMDYAVILRAQVIRAEISIENLANRLSLSTSINRDLNELIENQPGLRRIFESAVAVRFIEIAVRYRRAGRESEETLDFTLTDRNTCSLLSLEDHFEQVLGHQLLRHWGIMNEGRAPTEEDSRAVLPALLALWDSGTEKVSGAWLGARNIDVSLLTEIGFLVPSGWEDEDVIDDEDSIGQTSAAVFVHSEGVDLKMADGHRSLTGSPENFRLYRVRDGWVEQHLLERLASILEAATVVKLNANVIALGTFQSNGRDVPVYIARQLHDDRIHASVDTELRARHNRGIGLVLQTSHLSGSCLAANVVTPITDHIEGTLPEITLNTESLKAAFHRNRGLASGGMSVQLLRSGENAGTLFVPGKGSIQIPGASRLLVIERLVDAHNSGSGLMKTGDMTRGIEGQSLANIFGQPLWSKLQSGFLHSPGKAKWQIAV